MEAKLKLPDLAELRALSRQLMESANDIELAKAIVDGDRIASYVPYLDWLKSGRHPALFYSQILEMLLFELSEVKDKKAFSRVIQSATKYLIDL